MNIFTKRELVVVEVVVLLVILFFVFPDVIGNINELVYLVFVVIPLGILIMTDKERRSTFEE